MDFHGMSRRIARRIAVPVEDSNRPFEAIPDYVRMFKLFDTPIVLHFNHGNQIMPMTTKVYSSRDPYDIVKLIRGKPTDQTVSEIKKFLESAKSNAINVFTNESSKDPDSMSSPTWLAHDLFHALEYGLTIPLQVDINRIIEGITEDYEIYEYNPYSNVSYEPVLQIEEAKKFIFKSSDHIPFILFWKSLPPEFTSHLPQSGDPDVFNDLMADIAVNFFLSGGKPEDGIKIKLPTVYIGSPPDHDRPLDSFGLTPPVSKDVMHYKLVPIDDPDTPNLVDQYFSRIYSLLRSEFQKLVNKIVVIG